MSLIERTGKLNLIIGVYKQLIINWFQTYLEIHKFSKTEKFDTIKITEFYVNKLNKIFI